MRLWLLAGMMAVGCVGPSDDDGKDTAPADTDTGGDTDTDTDLPDLDRDGDTWPASVDCDDTRADVHPGVTADVCNGRDDDCDQQIDEDPDLRWFPDGDGDGFGQSGGAAVTSCDPGAGYATNDADCDDADVTTFPGGEDRCDGADNDCNGVVDDGTAGMMTWYPDLDADGYGDAWAEPFQSCDPGVGYSQDPSDCDDGAREVSPAAYEACDGIDNDCNGEVDENEAEWRVFHEDADGDGAGSDVVVYGCDAESAGGVENDWDCDDSDPNEPVFVDASARSGSGTLDDPLGSVQDAIDTARTCVKVAAGTYVEDLDFHGRDIVVESLDGSGATTLRGTGRAPVVSFQSGESAAAVLRGFTITGGTGWSSSSYSTSGGFEYYYYYAQGGGLYLSLSSPTLEDLVVTGNEVYDYSNTCTGTVCYTYQGNGGGMYLYYGEPTLIDVDFVANFGAIGSAVYQNYGLFTGTRVRSRENSGAYYTWYSFYGGLDLENLEMNADYSSNGVSGFFLDYNATLDLRNATIVSTDYGVYAYTSTVAIRNSVVTGTTYGLYEGGRTETTWDLAYNDIWGNGVDYHLVTDVTGRDGNFSADPMFTRYTDDLDADTDDLTPSSRSPLLDAGDPDRAYDDVDGTRNDVGAFGGPNGSWE